MQVYLFAIGLLFQQVPHSAQIDPGVQLDRNINLNIKMLPDSPFVENYPADVFQSHNQVWSISEDQRGIMLFGNGEGWLEFDGAGWRHTSTNHPVYSMASDRHGVVYIGLRNDFGRLLPNDKGKLAFESLCTNQAECRREFNTVVSIRSTSQGVYFITRKGPIFRWANERLQSIHLVVDQHMSQVDDHLFVHNDTGIYMLQGNDAVFLPQTQSLSKNDQNLFVLPHHSQKLLIATRSKGFFLYFLGSAQKDGINDLDTLQEFAGERVQVFETPVGDYFKQHGLTRGLRLTNGNYVFSTRTGGLVFMDSDGRFLQVIDESKGLIDNFVQDLHQDKTGNLWVATNNGISYVELSSPLTHFENSEQTGFTLTATRYRGRLFVGGFKGAFYHAGYDEQNKPIFVPIHEATSSCWDMLVHRDRLFLAGEFGLLVIDGTQVIDQLKTKAIVYSLGSLVRFPKHVFIGFRGGFSALTLEDRNQKGARIRLIDSQQGNFARINGEIRRIVADPGGHLWLTDLSGKILHLRFRNDRVSDFDVYVYDHQHGLPKTSFNMIHIIDGRLVVGTRSGIYTQAIQDSSQTDPTSFTFALEKTFGQQPNQEGLRVHQIHKDKNGRIWISSLTSISSLTPRPDGSYKWNQSYFKKIKGCVEFMFFDEDDVVWFTNTKGLYRYDKKKEPKHALDFRAQIRQVSLNNGSVLFYGMHCQTDVPPNGICKYPALEQSNALNISLPYENNSLTFEFGATAFERPKLNRYSYKLDGYDDKWSDWTERTRKEYTSLSEGDYRFRVRARNLYEQVGREASYAFLILPPWHRTLWAYVFFFALAAGLFIAGFRVYDWRLLAARKRLEETIKERTAEIVRQKDEIQKKSEQICLTYDVGRMETANMVLHNVGNVLNSVNVSIYCIDRTTNKSSSRVLSKSTELLTKTVQDLEIPLRDYPKERKILNLLPKIATAWEDERRYIREQADQLNQGMELIINILRAQQNCSQGSNSSVLIKLSYLLDDALTILKVPLYNSGVDIEMPARRLPPIKVNKVQLTHVLINLIKNAKEAVEQNKTGNRYIKIVTDQIEENNKKFVTVRISDNGPGISEDNLEKISTFGFTSKEQGHGYGLHFCDKIMKSMGGSLRIESEGPGRGASFTLLFPLDSNSS